jgi:hypothetical protein
MAMRVRLAVTIAALAVAFPAQAQRHPRPLPPTNCYPFACPERPAPGPLPSEEALALGRRIVAVADMESVGKRTQQLVAMARAKEPPRPPVPTYPNGPIRAVPPVDVANIPEWTFVLQQRVIDHAALHYARKYSLDELKAMAAFFESPAGRKLAAERPSRSAEVDEELATPVLEDDLWNVACGTPVRQEVEDAPHHQFQRLHPPMDYPLPPKPKWCGCSTERSDAGAERRRSSARDAKARPAG